MPKCKGHLSSVELCSFLRKPFLVDNESEEFSSLHKIHEEINSEVVLKNVLHLNDEGVVGGAQNVPFELGAFKLLIVDDFVLSNSLHCIHSFELFVLDEENLPKRSDS